MAAKAKEPRTREQWLHIAAGWRVLAKSTHEFNLTAAHTVEDQDIFRTAEALIRNHGENADMECAIILELWIARGDKEAADVWLRVMQAIRELQNAPPN